MTTGFDTLTFAKRLTEAGERPEVAEAHALALKEFVIENLATKDELFTVRDGLSGDIVRVHDSLSGEIARVRDELGGEIARVRDDLGADIMRVREDLSGEIVRVRDDLSADITRVRVDLGKDIDTMGLKLTVRMGGMLVVAVGVLASINKFF